MPKRKAHSIRVKLDLVTSIRNGLSNASREMSIAESILRELLKEEVKLRDLVLMSRSKHTLVLINFLNKFYEQQLHRM